MQRINIKIARKRFWVDEQLEGLEHKEDVEHENFG